MRGKTCLLVGLIALAMIGASCAWIGLNLWRTRDDAIAHANQNNMRVASILSEQAAQSVQSIDLALDELTERSVIENIANSDDLRREFGSRAAFDRLARRLTFLPKADVISIVDRDGNFVLNTRAWPTPTFGIAGREPFEHLKSQSDHSLAISVSEPSLVNGEQDIYFSRRLENSQGDFIGTIAVGVRREYFLSLYDEIASIPGSHVTLCRTDGGIIASYAGAAGNVLQIPPSADWLRVVNAGGGSLRTQGRRMGAPQLTAIQPLKNYPLVLVVGVSEESVLKVWRDRAIASGLQSLAIVLGVTALVCGLLIENWKSKAVKAKIRKQSEDLQLANQLFDAVLSNMSQGVAMFDSRRRLVIHNQNYAQMYGISPADMPPGTLVGDILRLRAASGVIPHGDPEDYIQRRRNMAEARGNAITTDIELLRDGRYIQITHQPLDTGGWITTHEDVTARHTSVVEERERLEALVQSRTAHLQEKTEELSKALSQQQAINEQQRSFVSMASHEFRTPLAIIDSSAQKLFNRAKQLQPQDIVERADTIRRSVQRMTGLMESVLSAAKFEHGDIKLSLRQADLYQVVFDCCFRHWEVSARHRINMDIDELPRFANIDAKAIDQVLTNLISNAIKFSPDATIVNVRGRIDGDRARIDVEDFGVGIDPEDMPKMFRKFFRAKSSTGIAGTGIGLSVVKLIVDRHGGDIHLTSVRDRGSVFTIYLPLAAANSKPDDGSQPDASMAGQSAALAPAA